MGDRIFDSRFPIPHSRVLLTATGLLLIFQSTATEATSLTPLVTHRPQAEAVRGSLRLLVPKTLSLGLDPVPGTVQP
jgi:hypothetical protein